MRILLISLHYYPEPNTKPHDLAQELISRGYEVFAITGFPHYPGNKLYDGYRLRLWQWETIDRVRVLRVPLYINRSKSAIQRILYYFSFSLSAIVLGALFLPRPDIIWTYGIGLPGFFLSKLKRAPYIHEVQDLWPEWGRTAGIGMRDWLYKLLEQQERLVRRSAKAVVTISEGFKQILIAKGTPEEKISIISNWANEQCFFPAERDLELGQREGLLNHFNVMYIGNVGTAQALEVVVQAAKLLHDEPEVQFVIIGDGVELEELIHLANQENLSNVAFLGSRPQNAVAAYAAFADVLLLHLKANPIYEITIPSKTYAYLATGHPILAAVSGDAANLIELYGAGLVIPPDNPEAMADAVRKLRKMSVDERRAIGRTGRKVFLANFTRQILVDRYESLFEHIAHD